MGKVLVEIRNGAVSRYGERVYTERCYETDQPSLPEAPYARWPILLEATYEP
jgi:hypothetical protein